MKYLVSRNLSNSQFVIDDAIDEVAQGDDDVDGDHLRHIRAASHRLMDAADADLDPTDDSSFSGAHRRRCCCFWVPSSPAERSDRPAGGYRRWWSRALMKLREWSELVAGPRWKTFIRRFNRNHPYHRHFGSGRIGSCRFQYDPCSYALNFDEGHGGSPEGDYTGYRNFSARFAVPPSSAVPSLDLDGGGRNASPRSPVGSYGDVVVAVTVDGR